LKISGGIRDYIAPDNPTAAKSFVERLRPRCRLLSEQPLIGRERPDIRPGLRSLPTQNYVVFYRLVHDTLQIVSVVHGSRDVDTLFDGEQ
jgi:toxin ParE1/3/4